ncbi:PfkB family carbohydrate kinase [Labrys wisconsinensis]|uniref:Ribokinase n=1 Tax=Labrys wisconsinensis TaxID=425677 RepID=A0ABU0JGI2_9HYPH|nr:PfkB family carbohydrate kinase [Labrys wisconsinensis]MDQ0472576.1 ribokinase [Labrys wisconsinensis]
MAAFDIIVCGSLHLDIRVEASRLPRLDETAVGRAWAEVCGGKGGNQAAQAARQGARTAMIGRVGRDSFGEKLLAHLDRAGVDRRAVETDEGAGSGMSVAIVEDGGQYGAVIVSGANLSIAPDGAAAAWDRLGGARALVLQNEAPHAVNAAVARAARAAGAAVILNAAPARPLGEDLLDLVDVLVVNRIEAEMLTGLPVIGRPGARAALAALGAGRRSVVVTLGGEGLVAAGAGETPFELAAEPVTVVSTHGAGDCFVGALAGRLVAGEDLRQACAFANRAAAAFVSRRRD